MEKKPTIYLIKKCKQYTRTLSLQEKDKKFRVEGNRCSTFLSKSGLLAQGDYENFKLENALITFWDPKTAEVKGGVFWFWR